MRRLPLAFFVWSAAAGVDGTHTRLSWSKEAMLSTSMAGLSMEYVGGALEKIVVFAGHLSGATWIIDDNKRSSIIAGAAIPFRYRACSTVLFGTTVIFAGGGINGAGVEVVDLFQSADAGVSWFSIGSSGWTEPVHACSMISTGPNEVIAIGGQKGAFPIANRSYYNTVRRSNNAGTTWIDLSCSSGTPRFAPQSYQAAAYMDDFGQAGRIVLIGGELTINHLSHVHKQVWYSDDKGLCWSLTTDTIPFESRSGAQLVYVPRTAGTPFGDYPYGALIMAGGDGVSAALNDVWRSLDAGVKWTRLTPRSALGVDIVWSPRSEFQVRFSEKTTVPLHANRRESSFSQFNV